MTARRTGRLVTLFLALWASTARAQDYNLEQAFPGPAGTSSFGASVALDGTTLAIGDGLASALGVTNAGYVQVFVKQAGAWVLQQQITPPAVLQREFFGSEVDLSGDTMIVGAPADLSGRPGRAYIYVRSGGTWAQQAVLSVSTGSTQDLFGAAVALSGNVAVVNAPSLATAYIFERTGTAWTQVLAVPSTPSRSFDVNVDVSGTTACVGAPGSNLLGNTTVGSIRVFERGGGGWTLQQTIPGPTGALNFGGACAVDTNTLVIASTGTASAGAHTGAVHVYTRSGATWSLQQSLAASDGAQRRFFGTSVSLAGNELAVGASGSPGLAYVFQRSGSTWTQRQRLADTAAPRGFGQSVRVDAATLLIGAYSSGGNGAATFSRTAPPLPPPPAAPANLQASVSGNTVSLTWSAGAGGGAASSYVLLARLAVGGPIVATLPVGAATSFGLAAPNGTFVVTVRASNAAGNSAESLPVTVSVPQAAAAPGAPTGLAASVTGTSASFTWNAAASGGAATSYLLVAGTSPGFTTPLATLPLPLSPRSATVANVPPGTYFVRVLASNSGGNSAPSNEVQVTVAPLAAPGVPTLNTPSINGALVTLTWAAGSGGAVASYTLHASVTPGGAPIAAVPVNGTHAIFQGLPSGTYYLRLTATNAAGTSAPSNQVTLIVP